MKRRSFLQSLVGVALAPNSFGVEIKNENSSKTAIQEQEEFFKQTTEIRNKYHAINREIAREETKLFLKRIISDLSYFRNEGYEINGIIINEAAYNHLRFAVHEVFCGMKVDDVIKYSIFEDIKMRYEGDPLPVYSFYNKPFIFKETFHQESNFLKYTFIIE